MIDHCSWFPEGNWGFCCAIHDLTSKGGFDWPAHWALAKCVGTQAKEWVIGIIMFIGLVLGGPFYDLIQKTKRK